jgi:molybdate transport repressor ModE-like protein
MEKKASPSFKIGLKIWFTSPAEPRSVFGPGDVKLIKTLLKTQNLTQAAQDLGYSYKYAWQKLHDLTEKTGRKVVETHRGGYGGGGQMKVTPWGKYLVSIYNHVAEKLNSFEADINQYLSENTFES